MVAEEGRMKCLRSLRAGALTSVESVAAGGGDPGPLGRRLLLDRGVRRPRPPAPLRISRLGSQA